jgi:hypothetical protein
MPHMSVLPQPSPISPHERPCCAQVSPGHGGVLQAPFWQTWFGAQVPQSSVPPQLRKTRLPPKPPSSGRPQSSPRANVASPHRLGIDIAPQPEPSPSEASPRRRRQAGRRRPGKARAAPSVRGCVAWSSYVPSPASTQARLGDELRGGHAPFEPGRTGGLAGAMPIPSFRGGGSAPCPQRAPGPHVRRAHAARAGATAKSPYDPRGPHGALLARGVCDGVRLARGDGRERRAADGVDDTVAQRCAHGRYGFGFQVPSGDRCTGVGYELRAAAGRRRTDAQRGPGGAG